MPRRRTDTGGLKITGVLMGGAFAATAFTQINVQVLQADWITDQGRLGRRRSEAIKVDVPRGAVNSADGKVVIQSEDVYELGLFYDRIPRSPGFFMELSRASGIPEPELREPAHGKEKKRIWRTMMAPESAARVKQVQKDWAADGVSIARAVSRTYPLSEAMAGITGSFRENTPFGGLEKGLDAFLKGKGTFDRDVAGLTDAEKQRIAGAKNEGEDGRSAELTINSELQVAATEALRRGVEENKAERGSAIILDPKTGDLVAMANWPSYDPTRSAPIGTDYNLATMAVLEPGSTFKLITLAKGFSDGKVGFNEPVASPSGLSVGNGIVVHNHDSHAHGTVTPEKAIAVSSNTAAATWALRIGRDSMVKFLDDSGMLKKPELGIPGVQAGMFNRNDYAKRAQLAMVGFGQSLNLTPVRLASLFGMLANDGEMMEPRLVKSLGGVELAPVSRGQLLKKEACREVLRISESVITDRDGTGNKLKVPGLRLGGKTGTAQKTGADNKVGSGGYVANFVGFVPVDQPKYVVLVMVDQPKGKSIYGGSVAGPVFVDIAKTLLHLGYVKPSSSVQKEERYKAKNEADTRQPD